MLQYSYILIRQLLIISGIFCLQLNHAIAQDTVNKSNPYIFVDGLYIESNDAVFPWVIDYNKFTRNFPTARFKKSINKRTNRITINSVHILWAALLSKLTAKVIRKNKSKNYKVFEIIGITDSLGYQRLCTLFREFTSKNGNSNNTRTSFSTSWRVNDSWVRVGYKKKYGYYFYLSPNKFREPSTE